MPCVTLDDWVRWQAEGYTCMPFACWLSETKVPRQWQDLLDSPTAVLLESGHGDGFTYFCRRPARVVVGDETSASITSSATIEVPEQRTGSPLEIATAFASERRAPAILGWPAITTGVLALFGYDLVQTWEKISRRAARDLALPLYVLVEPAELFVYDHDEQRLGVVVWRDVAADSVGAQFVAARLAADAAIDAWLRASDPESSHVADSAAPVNAPSPAPVLSFSRESFCEAVRRVQAYIADGHTYQVNLSLRESRATHSPPEAIYEALRAINPSPYMGFVRTPQFSLVCGSPELLVRVKDNVVSSRPIAGTRPRGSLPEDDASLSAELFASPKERAEHLMLVDLIRNDIGRVASHGSVVVREFMALEKYSHVMHIVSQVEGRLAPDVGTAEIVRSMFPGGTITGCPKVRTMEIIEELEPVGRGFYTGALGWITANGELELNIIIRSMLVKDGVAHVQAGAGIVADSVPERELDESLRKAKALWVALERASAAPSS